MKVTGNWLAILNESGYHSPENIFKHTVIKNEGYQIRQVSISL